MVVVVPDVNDLIRQAKAAAANRAKAITAAKATAEQVAASRPNPKPPAGPTTPVSGTPAGGQR